MVFIWPDARAIVRVSALILILKILLAAPGVKKCRL